MMQRLYPAPGPVAGIEDLETEYLVAADCHVRANFIVSLDGMVEVEGRSGPLGGEADHAAFMAMRAVSDAILVGAGTVRQERYGPVRLDAGAQGRRRARQQVTVPRLAIVSNQADLDPSDRIFAGDNPPLLLTTKAAAERRVDLADVAEVVPCGDQWVDITVAVDELRARQLGRILCEGGPTLLLSLLAADLLDELCYTSAPTLVGMGHRSLLGDQPLPDSFSLRLTAVLEGDGMLLSRYQCCTRP
jgi:riboflavin biosynthesis pyrimidine reductase